VLEWFWSGGTYSLRLDKFGFEFRRGGRWDSRVREVGDRGLPASLGRFWCGLGGVLSGYWRREWEHRAIELVLICQECLRSRGQAISFAGKGRPARGCARYAIVT